MSLVTRPEMTWYLELKGHPTYKLEKMDLKAIRNLYAMTKNPIKAIEPEPLAFAA